MPPPRPVNYFTHGTMVLKIRIVIITGRAGPAGESSRHILIISILLDIIGPPWAAASRGTDVKQVFLSGGPPVARRATEN
jgi:hypothetical protein